MRKNVFSPVLVTILSIGLFIVACMEVTGGLIGNDILAGTLDELTGNPGGIGWPLGTEEVTVEQEVTAVVGLVSVFNDCRIDGCCEVGPPTDTWAAWAAACMLVRCWTCAFICSESSGTGNLGGTSSGWESCCCGSAEAAELLAAAFFLAGRRGLEGFFFCCSSAGFKESCWIC